MDKYSLLKSISKGVKYVLIFTAASWILGLQTYFPEWADTSLAGLLVLGLNYAKIKWGVRWL